MGTTDYNRLKNALNLAVAVEWLLRDAKDDFFPDPIDLRDLRHSAEAYLRSRQHRMLQIDNVHHITDTKPKTNGMLREAVWLHPIHRILYLGILHRFLPRLDKELHSGVYSFRMDRPESPDDYPFPNRMDRWKEMHNDFREAAMQPKSGAMLITDLASYFDHISCDQLCNKIRSVLGRTCDDADEAVIDLLNRLLNMWATQGYGIPQNFDPSSFFGSLYLNTVDHEMSAKRYTYFRWLDDIRIVAQSKRQALRALHDLQASLARERLFLATNKTKIITPDDPEWGELLDVEEDQRISDFEDTVKSRDCAKVKAQIPSLFDSLKHHSGPTGDERKFRAYANRLLDAGDFPQLRSDVHPRIQDFVIPRLDEHPDRSDYWVKMLSANPTAEVVHEARRLLLEEPSLYNWQRFYLWKLLLHCDVSDAQELIPEAIETITRNVSDLEAAQAAVFAGKHGDNTVRDTLFSRHFSPQRPYPVQRGILVGIQELPTAQRDVFYERAVETRPGHAELVDYLKSLDAPDYGIRKRAERECSTEPLSFETYVYRGIGLVGGKVTRFRLSRSDADYD